MTQLPEIQVKSVRSATITVDKAEGVVEAFAAAIGNKDSVGDIILPGAFNRSLKTRKPRVVWGHDWNNPIGKVLEIVEVPSSDPRLPAKMKQAGVGGLFVKVQFNLASERGREAFASVLFFGEDQEWSIGYKTINADVDHARQANLLKEVELYEVSPVLHGANNLTGTISVKDDQNNMSTAGTDFSGNSYTTGTTGGDISFSYTPSTTTVIFDEKAYFDGHTYPDDDVKPKPADDESDERRMVRKAFEQALGDANNLRFVDDDKVIFDKPGEGMWMSKYRRDGRVIQMTRPVRARSQVVYLPVTVEAPANVGSAPKPMPEPEKPGRHECSCGNPTHSRYKEDEPEKSGEPEGIETKVGRVLSNANMGKLRQASELLNSVVSSGLPPEKPTMEDEAEEKKTLTKVVHVTNDEDDAPDPVDVLAFQNGIGELATKHAWGVDYGGAGSYAMDIHLSTDDNISEQVKELAEALNSVGPTLGVTVEKKDV